ncbi:hypothetical protein PM082_013978 [Marasmius tenuissimus]|nr:hypothetical protein PM082_013978 [Marasmius tenuissimus]
MRFEELRVGEPNANPSNIPKGDYAEQIPESPQLYADSDPEDDYDSDDDYLTAPSYTNPDGDTYAASAHILNSDARTQYLTVPMEGVLAKTDYNANKQRKTGAEKGLEDVEGRECPNQALECTAPLMSQHS